MSIRPAAPADLPAIIALSEEKRTQYEPYQPVFWKKAADSAEKHMAFLPAQMARENVITLVHEVDGRIDGFIIGTIVPSPPVYAPGGPTCAVDDYWVAGGADWNGVGAAPLDGVSRWARERGAAQMVVVTAQRDLAKAGMLREEAYSVASEWWVRSLK